jgi:hypothetical protein
LIGEEAEERKNLQIKHHEHEEPPSLVRPPATQHATILTAPSSNKAKKKNSDEHV